MQNNALMACYIIESFYFYRKHALFCTMEFYKILKERRQLLELTQQDLADYSGLSVRIIKSIEAGKGNPSINTLRKITEVLGLEITMNVKDMSK